MPDCALFSFSYLFHFFHPVSGPPIFGVVTRNIHKNDHFIGEKHAERGRNEGDGLVVIMRFELPTVHIPTTLLTRYGVVMPKPLNDGPETKQFSSKSNLLWVKENPMSSAN